MGGKDRGPRPQPDERAEFLIALRGAFRWRGDAPNRYYAADPTGWWADPAVLTRLGSALVALHDEQPTAVIGVQSRGTLLGALVAAHLGVGLVEVFKNHEPYSDSEQWASAFTPPDYRNRTLRLSARRDHVIAGQRLLFVDEWIDTGGQAVGVRDLVRDAGATWCGAAVVVDGLEDARLRRDLGVRSLLRRREL